MSIIARNRSQLHWGVLGLTFLLSMISIWTLHGTVGPHIHQMHLQQMYWLSLGFAGMIIVSRIEYHFIQRLVPTAYIGALLLLMLVLVIGKKVNGSRRWIDLGFANIQPSEFAKITLILALAQLFQKRTLPEGYHLKELIPYMFVLGLPMLFIFMEPDLGQTLMFGFIGLTMLSYEPVRRRAVIVALFSAIGFAPFAWTFLLKNYQKERIMTLIDGRADQLGAGWHSSQAMIAVGSGGLFGKGHGQGTQVAGGFLPENHTDFIFAKLCEEQGLFGGSIVLVIYLALIIAILTVAYRARDRFGTHVALGVAALIFWHVVMNIGMVLNLLPVTGVTLPILSYGGSSLLTVLLGIGLVLNIHRERSLF